MAGGGGRRAGWPVRRIPLEPLERASRFEGVGVETVGIARTRLHRGSRADAHGALHLEVSRRYSVWLVGARGPGDWDGKYKRSV